MSLFRYVMSMLCLLLDAMSLFCCHLKLNSFIQKIIIIMFMYKLHATQLVWLKFFKSLKEVSLKFFCIFLKIELLERSLEYFPASLLWEFVCIF